MLRNLVSTLLVCGIAMPAYCDLISDLPADWRQVLAPIEEIDISTLKPDEQQAINTKRAEISRILLARSRENPSGLARMYGTLGSLYQAHGLYTSADNCYQNAMLLEPGSFRWAYYLAYNAHRSGNMPVALQRLQKALELEADYPPVISRLAQTYLDLNQLDNAQIEFGKLLDKPDFRAAGHNGLGQVMLLKHEYTQAAEHFTRALELEPEATQLHYPLAQALRAAGQNELAQAHLRKYGNQKLIIPDPLVDELETLKNPAHQHFVNAMTWVMKKQYRKARSEFEAGLRMDPKNTAARTSYARALYLDGDSEQARTELNLVLRQDPKKHLALFLLALLEDAAGNSAEAAKLYRGVLEIDPSHDGAGFFLGNYHMRNRNFRQAIEYYDQAIANDPSNLSAHIFRLVAMMGAGTPDPELLAAVETVIAMAPASYPPQRIRILLLAQSADAGVRNPGLASNLAEQLYLADANPLNTELLAMTKATSDDIESAVTLMQQAAQAEQKQGRRFNAQRMQAHLAVLRNRQIPTLEWTDEIRYLIPPSTNPLASFRDYPDANPI